MIIYIITVTSNICVWSVFLLYILLWGKNNFSMILHGQRQILIKNVILARRSNSTTVSPAEHVTKTSEHASLIIYPFGPLFSQEVSIILPYIVKKARKNAFVSFVTDAKSNPRQIVGLKEYANLFKSFKKENSKS